MAGFGVSEPGCGAWAIGNSGRIGADDEESGRRCVGSGLSTMDASR